MKNSVARKYHEWFRPKKATLPELVAGAGWYLRQTFDVTALSLSEAVLLRKCVEFVAGNVQEQYANLARSTAPGQSQSDYPPLIVKESAFDWVSKSLGVDPPTISKNVRRGIGNKADPNFIRWIGIQREKAHWVGHFDIATSRHNPDTFLLCR